MILVTGGTGYIGSHICVVLMETGHDVVVLDSLANSDVTVLDRIAAIVGRRPAFVHGDIRDGALVASVLASYAISAVVHLAGLKAVGESIERAAEYYDVNVVGSHVLLTKMLDLDIHQFVFSSSATVYGATSCMPLSESASRSAANPYGRTKLIVEYLLEDVQRAHPELSIACLRYFNPVGAHESGLIGERPTGVPNNLMPYLCQVAAGERKKLSIFGGDYPTPDGTGVRDFVHVVDLALGHAAALRYCQAHAGMTAVNLGTGRGHSVLQLVGEFETATGARVPYEIVGRRAGDVASCWADAGLAKELLGWEATRSVRQMCEDSWRWQCGLSRSGT